MKSPVTYLEDQFESLLDNYCKAVEQGKLQQAEAVSAQAATYLEAIGVLKCNDFLSGFNTYQR